MGKIRCPYNCSQLPPTGEIFGAVDIPAILKMFIATMMARDRTTESQALCTSEEIFRSEEIAKENRNIITLFTGITIASHRLLTRFKSAS